MAQFSQEVATTFERVSNQRNQAADQWSDSSFLKALEKRGGLKRVGGGVTFEYTLDYQANPAAAFLTLDTTPTGTSKTEVLDAASYTPALFVCPINWTIKAEIMNSEGDRKVALIAGLVNNMLRSHDQSFEDALTAATGGTNGFNTIVDLFTEDGEGTVGGFNAATDTWWANQFKDWGTDTGATLIGDYTTLYNSCAKGSMGKRPNLIIGSATIHANFEAALAASQRFVESGSASGGFTDIRFHNVPFEWTGSYTSDSAWMFNTEDTFVQVIRSGWRQRRPSVEFANAAMVNQKIVSVAQFVTRNRSRGGVLFT